MSTATILEDDSPQKLDLQLWRRVFAFSRPHRRLLYPLAAAALLVASADASFALITRAAIDDAVASGVKFAVARHFLTYVAAGSVLAVGVWAFIRFAAGLSNHVSHDIRAAGFARLQDLELAYYDHRPVGWLISRLTSDCDKLARIIAWGLLDMLWASCLVVMIAIILLVLNWKLGLVVLSVLPPLIGLSLYFQKRLLLSSRLIRKFNSQITAAYNEGLAGLRTTKTLVREQANLEEFQHLSSQMYVASVRNALQSSVYLPVVLTLGSLAAGLSLAVGGSWYVGGALTLGTLVAFLTYAGQFFGPIHQLAHVLTQLQGAQAAGERVLSLLATEPRIQDSATVRARLAATPSPPPPGLAPDGGPAHLARLEYRHVDFDYDGGVVVLRDFNLTVEAGQTIALVGPSGGGKSTLVSLAARFYEPTGGAILVNGTDYRERGLDWYQRQLGIVLQTPHLFGGTIRENIRYGRLDATDAEVEQAARLVHADGFIRRLENGYESEVGEGGSRLSTGERQLLSFARALLARPQIFIMDEATSSIDTGTEQLIEAALKTARQGRICFVIAHRLSTIRSADRILYLERGQIIEHGNHAELLALRGHYHALYTNQFRHEKTDHLIDQVAAADLS